MTPELHRQLRTLLAELYPTRGDLTRVAYDAGIPLAAVPLGSSALNDWDAVLHEAAKQQVVSSLLDVVRQQYPRQPLLAEISASLAASQRAILVASLPASNIHLLNFTYELTAEQYEQIEVAVGQRIGKVVHLPVEFDNARPLWPTMCEPCRTGRLDQTGVDDIALCGQSAWFGAGGAGAAR